MAASAGDDGVGSKVPADEWIGGSKVPAGEVPKPSEPNYRVSRVVPCDKRDSVTSGKDPRGVGRQWGKWIEVVVGYQPIARRVGR